MPAVMTFAQRKQAGQQLLQSKQYAAAATEFRGALASMAELVDRLPKHESSPLVEQVSAGALAGRPCMACGTRRVVCSGLAAGGACAGAAAGRRPYGVAFRRLHH